MRFSEGVTFVRRFGPALALGGLALGALAIFEPSVLTSTARSPRAIGLVLALAVVTSVVGRIVTRRWGRGAGRLTGAVAIGLAVWLLVLPALRQTTLDEAFPVASASVASTTSTTSTTSSTTTPTVAPTVETAAFEATATVAAPPTTTTTKQVTTTTVAPAPKAVEPANAASGEPVQLTTGQLEGIDHQATGTVSVFRLADGSAVVRFEEVDIRGSPDPVLYLVPGADRRTRDGGLRVANLKGTKGSFNHTVPASFDLDQPFTVFIWCDRFTVPIANADQRKV